MNEARSPDEIRAEIEHTREELADTAAALAQRADVKARAHEKVVETNAKMSHRVDEAKAKMSHRVDEAKASPRRAGLVAAVTGGVLIGLAVLRRRR
jgi:hypothetical protein